MRDAAGELSDCLHLLRLLQLLLETTSFRHIVSANDDPARRAELLRRRRNNRLDNGVALSSFISEWRTSMQTCRKMGLDV